jgi:hypothetical protein
VRTKQRARLKQRQDPKGPKAPRARGPFSARQGLTTTAGFTLHFEDGNRAQFPQFMVPAGTLCPRELPRVASSGVTKKSD